MKRSLFSPCLCGVVVLIAASSLSDADVLTESQQTGGIQVEVREADDAMVAHCTYLGDVHATSGWGNLVASAGISSAKNSAKKKAAEKGATHIVWGTVVGGYSPSVTAKAYRCPTGAPPVTSGTATKGTTTQQGDAVELYNLGVAFANALGTSRNDEQMLDCFRKSAEQGYAPAQFALGVLYTKGEAISKDAAHAAAWLLKAAEQGYGPAQNNLSGAYANGDGVPQDNVQAYKWATLAVSSASGDALKRYSKNRDVIITRLTITQLAEGDRLVEEWLKAFAAREKKN
jgi:hypothetical protein